MLGKLSGYYVVLDQIFFWKCSILCGGSFALLILDDLPFDISVLKAFHIKHMEQLFIGNLSANVFMHPYC